MQTKIVAAFVLQSSKVLKMGLFGYSTVFKVCY